MINSEREREREGKQSHIYHHHHHQQFNYRVNYLLVDYFSFLYYHEEEEKISTMINVPMDIGILIHQR